MASPADSAVASTAERVVEAAEAVRELAGIEPRVGLILGSGLGDLADEIRSSVSVPFAEIPNFPVSTVAGHAGTLVLGLLEGTAVAAQRAPGPHYQGD
jgi:purine-nucleoside phosphorylase